MASLRESLLLSLTSAPVFLAEVAEEVADEATDEGGGREVGTGVVSALEWPVAPCALVEVDTGVVPALEWPVSPCDRDRDPDRARALATAAAAAAAAAAWRGGGGDVEAEEGWQRLGLVCRGLGRLGSGA